jgi:hypothetical protein
LICAAFAAIGFLEARSRRNVDVIAPSVIGALVGLCVWVYFAYYTNLFRR